MHVCPTSLSLSLSRYSSFGRKLAVGARAPEKRSIRRRLPQLSRLLFLLLFTKIAPAGASLFLPLLRKSDGFGYVALTEERESTTLSVSLSVSQSGATLLFSLLREIPPPLHSNCCYSYESRPSVVRPSASVLPIFILPRLFQRVPFPESNFRVPRDALVSSLEKRKKMFGTAEAKEEDGKERLYSATLFWVTDSKVQLSLFRRVHGAHPKCDQVLVIQ